MFPAVGKKAPPAPEARGPWVRSNVWLGSCDRGCQQRRRPWTQTVLISKSICTAGFSELRNRQTKQRLFQLPTQRRRRGRGSWAGLGTSKPSETAHTEGHSPVIRAPLVFFKPVFFFPPRFLGAWGSGGGERGRGINNRKHMFLCRSGSQSHLATNRKAKVTH